MLLSTLIFNIAKTSAEMYESMRGKVIDHVQICLLALKQFIITDLSKFKTLAGYASNSVRI